MSPKGERPNFGQQAEDLNPNIELLATQINGINAEILTLKANRNRLLLASDAVNHNRSLLRELENEIIIRERIQTEASGFSLIAGINDFALKTLCTSPDALQLAEFLSDDVSAIAINQTLDYPSPSVVIRVGRHGSTSMVLFEGIPPDQTAKVKAVVLGMGEGSMRAYNTEYFQRPLSDGGNLLVQNQIQWPPIGFSQLYNRPTVEQELESFLGPAKYQTALSLVSNLK